jgi:LDH2 family malate/lactate/ureidoglycolate dehydrogenase
VFFVAVKKGQCFMAIDPSFFGEGFQDRLQHLMDACRNSPPVEADKPVLVPGDPERSIMRKADAQHGISYHVNQIKYAVCYSFLFLDY